MAIVNRPFTAEQREIVSEATNLPAKSKARRDAWLQAIHEGIQKVAKGIQGMIFITHQVEGGVDAVIHLSDWADVAGKPDLPKGHLPSGSVCQPCARNGHPPVRAGGVVVRARSDAD